MAFTEYETDSSKLFLKSVNILLQTIGELPLKDDTDIENVLEAQIASDVLVEIKKEVLSEGWDFNTDEGYTLPVDTSGYIAIPFNVLDVSSTDGDLISREWKLYSRTNQSYKFDDSQDVDIVWDIDFNSLTHPIRNYITIRASRIFQARQITDTNVYAFTKEDEEDALIRARRSDGRTGKYNMLSSAYGTDIKVF